MKNARYLKQFKRFKTLVVTSQEGLHRWRWFEELSESAKVLTYEEAAAQDRLFAHILFFEDDVAAGHDVRHEAFGTLKKIGRWYGLLCRKDTPDTEVYRLAQFLGLCGAIKIPAGLEEAAKALAGGWPLLAERWQEQVRLLQLQKASDFSEAQVLVGEEGEPIYLNKATLRYFKSETVEKFIKEIWPSLKASGLPEEVGGQSVLEWQGSKFLTHCGGNGERLYTFCPVPPELDPRRGRMLSRIELIDRLKDIMAQRSAEESPWCVGLFRLRNFQTVVDALGDARAYGAAKAFGSVVADYFEPLEAYGFWRFDTVAAVVVEDGERELLKVTETFLRQVGEMHFGDEGVSFAVDGILVEVAGDDLDGLIALMGKAFDEGVSVADLKGITLHRMGTQHKEERSDAMLEQFLTNILSNGFPIKLLNIYKGLPIATSSRLLKIEDEKLVVTAEKIQKFAMEVEKKVVIQSPHLPGDVEADVHVVDAKRPLAVLKNPRLLPTSINNRKHTRVSLTQRLPVTLKLHRSHYSGYLLDMSIKSLAILFKPGRFEEGELASKSVRVAFRLPWDNDEGAVNIEAEGTVLFNREEKEGHKVVVLLESDEVSEGYLFNFIYKRQKELIAEIKSRIGG